ncbi:GntR family transcriptional regulator [Phytomonospora sp. NPDC050363]|uniref:GntR family transcriptional regulator n=1 Tax=Phytomonospora sp. NPDC050363 TaxID=3155642 RepID=UPI0033EDAF9A
MTETGRPGALRDRVYETLRRRIVEATAPPGQRLVERDLAAELEVSRIPLREALRLLAADGLVVTVPGRGTIVSPFTPDDVRDLFDVRESLEVLTARLAAERADADGLARLRGHLDRARAAMAEGDHAAVIDANADFHDELVTLAGNALLASMARPLSGRTRRLFHLTADRDQSVQCAEHEQLYDAIAAHDAVSAAEHAARHVTSGREHSLAAAANWSEMDAESLTRTRRRTRR